MYSWNSSGQDGLFQIMQTVNNEQESIMVSEEHFVCESFVIDDWTYSEDDVLFLLEVKEWEPESPQLLSALKTPFN